MCKEHDYEFICYSISGKKKYWKCKKCKYKTDWNPKDAPDKSASKRRISDREAFYGG